MATFTVDVIEGGDFDTRRDPQTGLTVATATRVAIVKGLTDGSPDQSATALVRARAVVVASYPVFTPYNSAWPQCYVTRHRSEGLAENSDGSRVRIFYETPIPGGGSGGAGSPWIISDNTETELLDTQLDPATNEPLWVIFATAGQPTNKIQDIATVRIPTEVRTIGLDAVLPKGSMPALRTAAGRTNAAGWAPGGENPADFPAGYWAIVGPRSTTVVGSDFYRVHVELKTKTNPREDWSTYAMLRNPANGRFVASKTAIATVRAAAYTYGATTGNGIVRVGGRRTTNFDTLFGSLGP